MTSYSSVQCPAPVECGAESCTAPSVCISSCASMEPFSDVDLSPQHWGSIRAYPAAYPLLTFVSACESSVYSVPIPQYGSVPAPCQSTQIRYLRSGRSYPSCSRDWIVLSIVSTAVGLGRTT